MPAHQRPPNLISAIELPVNTAVSAEQQMNSWEAEKNAEPANGKAWLNYYIWTDRNKSLSGPEKKQQLEAILNESHHFIPELYEYYLMRFFQQGKKDGDAIYKALATAPDKSVIYPYLVQYAIISGNDSLLKANCREWDSNSRLTPALYQYHYNALMSADSNALIYASGIHDLVPMAVLQQVYGVRKDIQLKYYEGTVNTQLPSYLCMSMGKEVLSEYPDAGCTGLLVKISSHQSLNELRKHVEKEFNTSSLRNNAAWPPDVVHLYCNYLPALILLYRHYSASNDKRATEMKYLIRKISERAGKQEQISKIIGN
jgi:hypothetical protein